MGGKGKKGGGKKKAAGKVATTGAPANGSAIIKQEREVGKISLLHGH